jgi:aryl-alcohol dehydrogenase-like predicted oxidoreductase
MMTAERIELSPGYSVSRITKGNWQLAARHGPAIDREDAIEGMRRFVEAGFTNFDCADHYIGVEETIGAFRARHSDLARRLTVQTKIVPDRGRLPKLRADEIASLVDRSLLRLGVERLDVVQFHWWDYDVPGYLEAMGWLRDMQRAGKIGHLATTNFDCARLGEILDAGIVIVSNQVQYSVLDHRPENGMTELARAHGFWLQCYGALAGGFLSGRWLGAPEPVAENRSLVKYALIIEEFGGWTLFQEMLRALRAIGDKHGASIAAVATRYVLDRARVATAIVGARTAAHLADLETIASLRLDADDAAAIGAVVAKADGPAGDCYTLERIPEGRHGAIMWTNQNTRGAGAR